VLFRSTDEKFGARPLRRAIGAHLEDSLSEAILRGDFAGKAKVLASVAGEGDGRKLILAGLD
jgi:ATP-dependent Clp protease ATP-binding subunit ClpC